MSNWRWQRIILAGALVLAAVAIATAGWCVVTSVGPSPCTAALWWFKDRVDVLRGLADAHPVVAGASFVLLALVSAAIDVPAPGLVAAAGAAVLGVVPAVLLSLPAAALGATGPFLLARHGLGPWLRRRWPRQVAAVEAGVGRDGAFYLASLRLMPMMPFVAVNLFMGLTRLGASSFFVVTALGRLPVTIVYCLAASRLATIQEPADLLSWPVTASLVALSLLPLTLRWLVRRWLGRRDGDGAAKARDAA